MNKLNGTIKKYTLGIMIACVIGPIGWIIIVIYLMLVGGYYLTTNVISHLGIASGFPEVFSIEKAVA